MNPLVSVIMPVYNSALYVREAVESILSQSYTSLELIAVDDCSKDESLSILRSITDPRLRIIALEKNQGVSNARNVAMAAARGTYIAFMDSDDLSHSQRLQKQVDFLEAHPEADVVFTRVRLVDVYGNPNGTWPDDEKYIEEKAIAQQLPKLNCVSQPAACARAAAIKPYTYSTLHPDSEDWALWLRMLMDGKRLFKIDEALVDYRLRPSSETARSNKSPFDKLIRFRALFIQHTSAAQHAHPVVQQLKISLAQDKRKKQIDLWLLRPLRIAKKILRAQPWVLLVRFVQFHLLLARLQRYQRIYFFPFHHVGGAEKVHAAIVQACATDEKQLVLFTKKSDNTGMLSAFSAAADTASIWEMCWYPGLKTYAARKMAKALQGRSNLVVCSSNSVFFYTMLQHTSQPLHAVDLIHAFVHPEESGPEKWALPVVEKLERRIFIGQKTIDDNALLYARHTIDAAMGARVQLIRNYVSLPEVNLPRSAHRPLQLVYIGRGTAEKRVHLAAEIAAAAGCKLTLIGDVQHAVPAHLHAHCIFVGMLTREVDIQRHLQAADALLLTSAREGMPLVIMEAMANGVVPITTAVGDIANVIREGEDGFLLPVVPERQVVDQAVKALQRLQNDEALFRRIQVSSHARAQELFHQQRFTEAWRAVMHCNA